VSLGTHLPFQEDASVGESTEEPSLRDVSAFEEAVSSRLEPSYLRFEA